MSKKPIHARLNELLGLFEDKPIDMVRKTNLPKSSISLYLSGQRVPRQDKLSIIADAYNIDVAWLMGYDVPIKSEFTIEMAKTDAALSNMNERVKSYALKLAELSNDNQELIMQMIDKLQDKKGE